MKDLNARETREAREETRKDVRHELRQQEVRQELRQELRADSPSAMAPMSVTHDTPTGAPERWTRYLIRYLRVMAGIVLIKGLAHWADIVGLWAPAGQGFEDQAIAWQTATVFFAVIDLVAAVGLWLATPWGAVVWLTTVMSMAVVELLYPHIYGGGLFTVLIEMLLLAGYLALAWMAAHEHPNT